MSQSTPTSALLKKALPVCLGTLAGIAIGGAGMFLFKRASNETTGDEKAAVQSTLAEGEHLSEKPQGTAEVIEFNKEMQTAASVKTEVVKVTPFVSSVVLTGKVSLNEDQVAHIYPQVEGVLDSVKVQFGQKVKKGDELIVIRSREVGQAKLSLYQDRLLRDFTASKNTWTQETTKNTLELISALKANTPIEQLESQFRERPMGDFREKLMTAYVNYYRSRMDLERLGNLSENGTVPAKQKMAAEAALNADRATMQAALEQIEQDTKRAALLSAQALQEADVKVSVAETSFNILGYSMQDLQDIDPAKQGESLAFYPIRAPFDGTIITKDAALLERAKPDQQLLTIADLSTVWIKADIYEENLPLLKQLGNLELQVNSSAWPGRSFPASIFFTGEIVDEKTRTVSLIARADNAEGVLKPGMFVTVSLPSLQTNPVLQIPTTATLDYEGKTFVFVQTADDKFERRDIKIGRRSEQFCEITAGIKEGDQVVTEGGFALKSRMLSELIAGE